MDINAYISGPLQAAKELSRARSFYEDLAAVCLRSGLRAYLPHQQTDPLFHYDVSAAEVFQRDYSALTAADIVIAVIGSPSSGVGAELGIAHELSIPVIAMFSTSDKPSRFVLGLL